MHFQLTSQIFFTVSLSPGAAHGTFLRILTINDVYSLDHYPSLVTAINQNRAAAAALDCTFISTLNGDFLSPCILTSLDGGKGMMDAVSKSGLDYLCLGNHEFDLIVPALGEKLKDFPGKCLNTNGDVTKMPELAFLPTHDLVGEGSG